MSRPAAHRSDGATWLVSPVLRCHGRVLDLTPAVAELRLVVGGNTCGGRRRCSSMRIDIWSDVVCPWCYIGKRRLETALASFPHSNEVEIVYRSFELDPTAPEDGQESVLSALSRKYGGGPAAGPRMLEQVGRVGAEVGLRFDFADAVHARTLDAHRLLHLALAEGGPAQQGRVAEALFSTYFEHARSVGDKSVLREVAVGAGLDAARVGAVLSGAEYAEDVQADLAQARAYGITGVPFFVVDDRYAVSGAQPTEVFLGLLEQAWAAGCSVDYNVDRAS